MAYFGLAAGRDSGFTRKLRWGRSGKGKRGGVRVFYLQRESRGRIYLLLLLDKSERSDLSRREIAELRKVVEEELP